MAVRHISTGVMVGMSFRGVRRGMAHMFDGGGGPRGTGQLVVGVFTLVFAVAVLYLAVR